MLSVCANFEAPTPIQAQCWPILSSGRDIIGIAETGSGKTLAFTLPALVHILDKKKNKGQQKKGGGPTMLVIAPTRELGEERAGGWRRERGGGRKEGCRGAYRDR